MNVDHARQRQLNKELNGGKKVKRNQKTVGSITQLETKEEIKYSDTDRVSCSGENNDHPLVYYTIPEGGYAVCRYCEQKFKRKPK